jgi:hypothetical protein
LFCIDVKLRHRKEEPTLGGSEKSMLNSMFGRNMGWGRENCLLKVFIIDRYTSDELRISWAGNMLFVRHVRTEFRIQLYNLKGSNHLGDLDIDGTTIVLKLKLT